MSDHLPEFIPPHRILMGPGPSGVNHRVLQAMAAPLLGHLDPVFLGVMRDVREMLLRVFHTSNDLTLAVPGTGSAAMEAAFCNTIEAGDHAVIAVNGYFGSRMADIAARCGAQVHTVDFPWGTPVGPDLTVLEDEVKRHPQVKVVGMVHAETSTGVLSPIKAVADLAHRHGALLIADAVTSLAGEELDVDGWDIDVCYSGTQKCLGGPPGLSPITLGHRAAQALSGRKAPVQSFYLDLGLLQTYWSDTPAYHHTAPISLVYALREGLRLVMEEGLEARVHRHAVNAEALRTGLQALGFELFAQPGYRLNPLTTLRVPDGVDEAAVRRTLLVDHGIEIGGGLGETAGKVWRVGLMGDSSKAENVLAFLSALERILGAGEYEVAQGAGVAAAQRSLASSQIHPQARATQGATGGGNG